jgi:uncharacterized membrane protein
MARNSRTVGNGPTSLGLSERLERSLTYLVVWVSGLFFFFFERNRNVKMHAKQSVLVFGPLFIVWWLVSVLGSVLSNVWLIGWLIGFVFGLLHWVFLWVIIALVIWLMVMAFFKPDYKLPFVDRWL